MGGRAISRACRWSSPIHGKPRFVAMSSSRKADPVYSRGSTRKVPTMPIYSQPSLAAVGSRRGEPVGEGFRAQGSDDFVDALEEEIQKICIEMAGATAAHDA
jgi:hypothetical protein